MSLAKAIELAAAMTPAEREVLSHYLSTLETSDEESERHAISRAAQWRSDRMRSANAERQRKFRASKRTVVGGCVYIARAESTSLYKIGFLRDVMSRIDTLQTGSPHKLSLVHTFVGASESVESALHEAFAEIRRHGEWFDFGDADPVEACMPHVEELMGGSS